MLSNGSKLHSHVAERMNGSFDTVRRRAPSRAADSTLSADAMVHWCETAVTGPW